MKQLTKSQWLAKLKKEGFKEINICPISPTDGDPGMHTHDEHTVHVILEGELTIEDETGTVTYRKGDRVEFPAGTKHKAIFGPNGLTMIVGIKDDLPKLAAPAQRALANAGIQSLNDFSKITEEDFKNLHGIGPNALKTIKKALKEKNIIFAK